MDLFSNQPNILPIDGEAIYYGNVFSPEESQMHFKSLLEEIPWQNDESFIFGKLIITKRKVAWYANKQFEYTYSNRTKKALPWTNELLAIKREIENESGETYNSCLLNLYHSGEEGMGWHTDAEKELEKGGAIASVSFGATRPFKFKHKISKHTINVNLETGSLLVMKGKTQENWLHSLPKTKKVLKPRINLTFRQFRET